MSIRAGGKHKSGRRRVTLTLFATATTAALSWPLVVVYGPQAQAKPGGTHAAAVPAAGSERVRITPEQFGANGDDDKDDTAGLQRAFDAAGATSYVEIAAGKSYRHSDVLRITHQGTVVQGQGTILATNQERSAIFADADDVTFTGGLTVALTQWTKRHANWETTGIRGLKHRHLTLRDVTMKELGVYLNKVDGFEVSRVKVVHSQADGIHLTGGSSNGTVTDVTTTDTGDDGVAVVSNVQDGPACKNITITRPRVLGSRARGVSVIGGSHITYNDVYVERSAGAGVIAASEPRYTTWAPRDVKVNGATIIDANVGAPDHGAVLVHSARTNAELGHQPVDMVRISNVTIKNTNPAKSADVRVSTDNGATLHNVILENFTITGGPTRALSTDQDQKVLTIKGWTKNGAPFQR